MFWKKKTADTLEVLTWTTEHYIGRPILDGGNKFYPVLERHFYSNGYNFIPPAIIEYFSTREDAEKYIEKRNDLKLENAAF